MYTLYYNVKIMDDILKKAIRLYNRVDSFFIGSIDDSGFPNIKAVSPVNKRESISEIFFSTNTSSRHVDQFRTNCRASVYYYDLLLFEGVMLKGFMEICEDAELKKRFWKRGDKAYYPLGETDPDYCILRFIPTEGRYYYDLCSSDFYLFAENEENKHHYEVFSA